jgi:hypothetical protein
MSIDSIPSIYGMPIDESKDFIGEILSGKLG